MFPAGDPRFRVRMLGLPSGPSVRVVECGDEQAPPILLYPGWACSVYVFRLVLPALASMGYRAIAVEMKGHGLSDKPRGPGEYTRPALVAHGVEIFDALALVNPVIGGHSLGAVLSFLVAAERRDSVRGLLLYSPVGYRGVSNLGLFRACTPAFARPLMPHVCWRWISAMVLALTYGGIRRPSARDVDEYWAPTQFPDFALTARDLLHQFDFGHRSSISLAGITHRSLVMYGSKDVLLDERAMAADASEMQRADVHRIPGAGHVICEETPDVVLEATRAFLESL
ncbi:MAG: alpha/beta hydrolase [Gemmatimonadaceae bacterium]|nr:alpha/beta hydrolase [Gemmatimonadaceae bacterium]